MVISMFEIIFSLLLIFGFINEDRVVKFEKRLFKRLNITDRNEYQVRRIHKTPSFKVVASNQNNNSNSSNVA